jgi:hypothetical protein
VDAKNVIVERALAAVRALNRSEPRLAPEALSETYPIAGTAVLAETPPACPQFTRWWEPGAECWHCHGRGQCRCIECDAGASPEPLAGPCVKCHGSGRVPERAQ